jgi:NAD(P)-dependent dehydrogenase (short-subunit alcohol dehydrogenase family)
MPVAVVTGASRGIGRGIVQELAKTHRVVATYRGREDAARSLQAETGAEIVRCDVSSAADREALAEFTLGRFGRVDLLVNNAGIASPASGPIEALPLTEWNRWLDSHLTGAFLCTRSAVPGLRLRRGSIVNISSTRALQSEPDCEAYAAAKGGLLSLTHALAVSLGPDIRVNALCPGLIETGPLQKKSRRRAPEHREIDLSQHPAGRVGEPADIASLVEYLSGPQAGFITGQHVVVDGGMTRRMIYAP